MRDRRMDSHRFSVRPFSVGCVSQSSVTVTENQTKRAAQAEAAAAAAAASTPPTSIEGCGDARRQAGGKPIRMSISASFQKLVKGFKSFSQLFVMYKEVDDEDQDEEIEMEIGFPTDVQHVGHIGWDGFNGMSAMKSWDKSPELLQLPSSFSLKQFELAMAAQAPSPMGALQRSVV